MKNVFLTLLFFTVIYVNGQNRIKFNYDSAGNQTQRVLCFGCSAKQAQDTITDYVKVKSESLNALENEIKFYPNPVSEKLYVKWNLIEGVYLDKIQVFSSTGQSLRFIENLNNIKSTSISFADLPEGAYFLQLIYSNGENKSITILKK